MWVKVSGEKVIDLRGRNSSNYLSEASMYKDLAEELDEENRRLKACNMQLASIVENLLPEKSKLL